MKSFKLESLQAMIETEKVAMNGGASRFYKIPVTTSRDDDKTFKFFKDNLVKESLESHRFVISDSVMKEVYRTMPPLNDVLYGNTKAREFLALPFDSVWIEGDSSNPILTVSYGEDKMCYFGVQITEHGNHYYISASISPLVHQNQNPHSERPVHYTMILSHDDVTNDNFETKEERDFYIHIHSILDLVTRHKKLTYIHNNQGMKMRTPKGVKKVHVNRVVKICLKEEGVKILKTLKSKFIEYSHQFPCMAHWRYYVNEPDFEGKDQKGVRNQVGRTWVISSVKGADKEKKKGQIRYVNQFKREHGKMPEVA